MHMVHSLIGPRFADPDGGYRSRGGRFENLLYLMVGIFFPHVSIGHTASISSVTEPVDALRCSRASQNHVNPLLKMAIIIKPSLSTRKIQGQRFGVIGCVFLPHPFHFSIRL